MEKPPKATSRIVYWLTVRQRISGRTRLLRAKCRHTRKCREHWHTGTLNCVVAKDANASSVLIIAIAAVVYFRGSSENGEFYFIETQNTRLPKADHRR